MKPTRLCFKRSSFLPGHRRAVSATFFVLVAVSAALAQNYLNQPGSPTFSTSLPVESGVMNLANGTLHLDVPMGSYPQRGSLRFNASLVYDNEIWAPKWNPSTGSFAWSPTNIPNSQGGWRFITSADPGTTGFSELPQNSDCTPALQYTQFQWIEPNGTIHNFPMSTYYGAGCATDAPTASGYAMDATGLFMSITNYTNMTVYSPSGMQLYPVVTDTNGNYLGFGNTNNPGSVGYTNNFIPCNGNEDTQYTNFTWTDPSGGTVHTFAITTLSEPVFCAGSTATGNATDSAGYSMFVTNYTSATVYGPDGIERYPIMYGNIPFDTLGRLPVKRSLNCNGNSNLTCYDFLNTDNSTSRITVTSGSIAVTTAFNQSGIGEFSGNITVVQNISLPDGSSYSFNYDSWGLLSGITLPTGGQITYGYTTFTDSLTGTSRWITSRTAGGGKWSFTPSVVSTNPPRQGVYVTTPSQDTINYSYTINNGAWLTSVVTYQGSGSTAKPLKTTINTWDFSQPCQPTPCTGAGNIRLTGRQILLPPVNGLNLINNMTISYVDTTSSRIKETDVYDFGLGQVGPLLRKTVTNYAPLGNNIIDHPSDVTIYDVNNNPVAKTSYNYDETSLATTSGLPHHVGISGSRGNLTTLHKWLNTTGGTLDTILAYDDAGSVQSITDPKKNPATTIAYQCSDAYPSQWTFPATAAKHVTSTTYDCNTGLVTQTTDENGQSTTYTYDSMLRTTNVAFADGGQTSISFPSFNQTVTQRTIDSSRSTYSTSLVDGYGRLSRTAVANGESTPYDQVDYCYDISGRLSFKSYPYQGNAPVFNSAAVCSGAGDTFAYDALGRNTQVTHSDGSFATTSFSGRASQVTDEGNGNTTVSRIFQSDGLGRLTNVCEVYGGAALLGSGGTAASCGLDIAGTGFLTTYTYNTLGDVLSVAQGALNGRSYQYDSLSRLTSAATPESGTITYGPYDNDGNLETKIDARGITTNYSYDVLNRLTQKTYSDGTPTANFVYDTDPGWTSTALTNIIGRLTEISTGSVVTSGTIFGYDPVGRLITNNQCTPLNCGKSNWAIGYNYDLIGDVTSATNGVGVGFNYSYNIAARVTGMTSSFADQNHPGTLLSAAKYSPTVMTDTLGNGIGETANYSSRGFLQSYLAAAPTGEPARGSVVINGSLQTYQVQTQAGQPATTTVTIGGADSRDTDTICTTTCHTLTVNDTGTIQFQVNVGGTVIGPVQYKYGNVSTATIASNLVANFPSNSLVSISYTSGASSFTLTTTAIGTGANSTTISSSVTSNCPTGSDNWSCPGPGFTIAPTQANFSGGQNPQFQTLYDNGSTTIEANGYSDSYPWSGSGTTAASIAAGLCGVINGDTQAPITASTGTVAGQCPLGSTTISLVAKQGGSGSDYALNGTSSSSVVNSFSTSCPSFQSCTSANLTGGGSTAYSYSLVTAPDGQVTSDNDLVNGNWTFGYDAFNRLLSSNLNSGQQTFTYDYDAYGNRWHQNAPQGGPAPQYVFNNNNQITVNGVTYDASGNVTADGLGNTFTWDAEGRLANVQQRGTVIASYVYGADGSRVEGPNGDYLYDLGGNMVTQIGLNGVWSYGEIYAGGRHLATYSSATTNFMQPDWLGTKRVMTAVNGTTSETCTGMPFGDATNCVGANWSFNGFTDFIHDPEDNLEHTLFRKYSSTQGRWMTPDPWGGSISLANPQTLNRYSYATNNPTNFTDPSGLVIFPHVSGSWYLSEFALDEWAGGGCTMDGVDADCGMVQSFLQQDAALVCPNNNCSRIWDDKFGWQDPLRVNPDTNQWQQWYPSIGIVNTNYNYNDPNNNVLYYLQTGFWGPVMPSNSGGDFSWWGAFFGDLFSGQKFVNEFKQGGCVRVFLNGTRDALMPFTPSVATVGQGTAGVIAATKYNAAVDYAASRGLTYPMKSSIVRSMLADANATAAEAPLFAFDGALLQGVIVEGISMSNGGCH